MDRAQALARAAEPDAPQEARRSSTCSAAIDPRKDANEPDAERLAAAFTDYLRASRETRVRCRPCPRAAS